MRVPSVGIREPQSAPLLPWTTPARHGRGRPDDLRRRGFASKLGEPERNLILAGRGGQLVHHPFESELRVPGSNGAPKADVDTALFPHIGEEIVRNFIGGLVS